MSLASIPGWMEWVIDTKYPAWRDVPTTDVGAAGTAPAGLRVLEAVLAREFGPERVVVCYPAQLPHFIGDTTRVVAVSTHNPLGTTFAAGVYASIFGSSREPINALYARRMFDVIREARRRYRLTVIVGGSGAWQIDETGTEEELGIDTIVTGRAESDEVVALFRRALAGDPVARRIVRRGAPRPALYVGAIHLYAAGQDPDAERRGRPRDTAPVEAAVAGDHESVGCGLSHRITDDAGQALVRSRRPCPLGRATAAREWPQFHLAARPVFGSPQPHGLARRGRARANSAWRSCDRAEALPGPSHSETGRRSRALRQRRTTRRCCAGAYSSSLLTTI